jgi:hypothetical protein
MKRPITRPKKNSKPVEVQSEDAPLLAVKKPRPPWETRQPAQITKSDVEQARAKPGQVTPPGKMGESQGAVS